MTTPQHEVHTQRTSGPFRLASQTTWKDPYHCCDLHADAQCPHQVGQAYSSAAQPYALHTAAGSCGTGRERRALRGDARTSARIRVAGRGGVWPVELGKAVEGMRGAWRPRLRS